MAGSMRVPRAAASEVVGMAAAAQIESAHLRYSAYLFICRSIHIHTESSKRGAWHSCCVCVCIHTVSVCMRVCVG